MGFAASHHTLLYNISHPDVGVYEQMRVKTTRHPEETDIYLLARSLVFAHTYSTGQRFSLGYYDESQPTIWTLDEVENVTSWIEVGCPDKKKLRHALRAGDACSIRVYFYSQDQIDKFCHYMRGSKENWIEPVQFFLLESEVLEQCAAQISGRIPIDVTFVDDIAYLTIGDMEVQTHIQRIDMWAHYQLSLKEALL